MALLLLAVGVSLSAGCGGSSRSDPTSVVRRYMGAVANNDGSTACELLTGEIKQRLLRASAALSVLTHRSTSLDCPSVVRFAHGLLGADQIAELRKANVASVSQSGNRATVRVSLPNGHATDAQVAKTAAGWLINSTPTKLVVVGPTGLSSHREVGESYGRAVPSYQKESEAEFQHQLSAGQIREATINKRIRTIRIVLRDGSRKLAHYPAKQERSVVSELKAEHVRVSILSLEQSTAEVETR
jgi:hypothetical protein